MRVRGGGTGCTDTLCTASAGALGVWNQRCRAGRDLEVSACWFYSDCCCLSSIAVKTSIKEDSAPPSQGFAAITEKTFSIMFNPQVCCKGSSGELPRSSLVYVMGEHWLNWAAWEGQGCSALWPLVQPAATLKTYSQSADVLRGYVYTMYIHLYVASHTDHRQSAHKNTASTSSHILFPSLAEQDGGPLMRMYVCMYLQGGSFQWLGSDTPCVK